MLPHGLGAVRAGLAAEPAVHRDTEVAGAAAAAGVAATGAMFETASDTEQHVARRLGVDVALVKFSARVLWDYRDFDDERDSRVGDVDELEPRSRQARRGLVTRGMLAELRAFLEEVYGARERGAGR